MTKELAKQLIRAGQMFQVDLLEHNRNKPVFEDNKEPTFKTFLMWLEINLPRLDK